MLGGGSWSPASLAPLAWYYASTSYVALSGSTVATWSDRSGNGNTLSQANPSLQPTWDTSGWGNGKPALTTNTLESLSLTSGSVLTFASGSDIPFTALATFKLATTADNTLCSWDHTSGSGASVCRMDNPSTNVLRYDRTDDVDTSANVSASESFVNGRRMRAAYVFSGSVITFYQDGQLAAVPQAANVGTVTLNRFRVFDGPGAADSFDGSVTELVIVPRALSDAEQLAYYTYSLGEWG